VFDDGTVARLSDGSYVSLPPHAYAVRVMRIIVMRGSVVPALDVGPPR